jgi:MioC protein
MSSVLIIFGSTGGNTELVTDKVSSVLGDEGHKIKVERAEKIDPKEIKGYKNIVFASSTYGHGLLQDHMKKLFKKSDFDLENKKCAVIGLGDNKYNTEYVIESANILEDKIKERNGELIIETMRINKTPVPHLNDKVEKWAKKLSKKI